jgi:adenylyl cyclase-associated protein
LEKTVGVAGESLFRQPASQISGPERLPPPPAELKDEPTDKMSAAAFNDIIQGSLSQYLQLSAKLGGDVATHAKLVEKAFQ